jgi:hypothetical protein
MQGEEAICEEEKRCACTTKHFYQFQKCPVTEAANVPPTKQGFQKKYNTV